MWHRDEDICSFTKYDKSKQSNLQILNLFECRFFISPERKGLFLEAGLLSVASLVLFLFCFTLFSPAKGLSVSLACSSRWRLTPEVGRWSTSLLVFFGSIS